MFRSAGISSFCWCSAEVGFYAGGPESRGESGGMILIILIILLLTGRL